MPVTIVEINEENPLAVLARNRYRDYCRMALKRFQMKMPVKRINGHFVEVCPVDNEGFIVKLTVKESSAETLEYNYYHFPDADFMEMFVKTTSDKKPLTVAEQYALLP